MNALQAKKLMKNYDKALKEYRIRETAYWSDLAKPKCRTINKPIVSP